MSKIIVVTSGKGGVGKTTTSASIATGLALRGHKTCVIDFDVGLRNLDLIMGCERRVVYDLVNVIQGEATAIQALLTVMAKTALSRNYRFELLTAAEAGFRRELAEAADQDPEMRRILAACHCNNAPLWNEINRLLLRRNIVFENARGNFVLTDAGRDFFEELFTQAENAAPLE